MLPHHHLEANMLARATEGGALGLPPPAASQAGAGGSPLQQSLEPSPPYWDSPWSKRQQAASSELRDNSLL